MRQDFLRRAAQAVLNADDMQREDAISEDHDDAAASSSPPTFTRSALYGPIGDWAALIEPHTEANLAALFFSALVGVGALIGRSPSIMLDGARHGVNLFALLVGATGTGRKGTACGRVRQLIRTVDPDFASRNVAAGLATGQGVIHHLRDAREARGEKGADAGVEDKRLLVIEAEFAAALRQLGREGNTLSPVLREGWDGNTLRTLTKGDPQIATDPHLAIIGQITPDELRRSMSGVETANGFANRFLFVWSERARLLPFDSAPDPKDEAAAIERIGRAVVDARKVSQVSLTPDAREWWADRYGALSTGRAGTVGAATQRATAQVRRIALLLTVLDGLRATDVQHFEAALALWDYAAGSAAFVLGGDGLSERARRIERALIAAGPSGLARGVMRQAAFGSGNVPASVIANALREVREAGLSREVNRDTTGRPISVWVHSQFGTGINALGQDGRSTHVS